MGDKLTMSRKERQRAILLSQVATGQISRREARQRLSVSGRQLKRIIKRYKDKGEAGLVHKHRGCPSNRIYPEDYRQKVVGCYREIYIDFGPTLASEKLKEREGLEVHPETLRRWLKAEGLWEPHRRRKQYRSHRARRTRYGSLLQLDGSIHAWFVDSKEKQCLINMVDDATGKTLALMDYGETTRGVFSVLKWWISAAGIPQAIYVDLKSLYVSPKSLRKGEEDEEGFVEHEWLTHFSKACKKLGIEVIKAYSPQAKGRVERNHAVYQDRFVKELKLRDIHTIEGANELLSGGFVNQLNEKFAKPAQSDEDAHVPLCEEDLDQILCWEYERQVKNDWTIQFEKQYYQIEKSQNVAVHAREKILVRRHLDTSLSLWHKGQRLAFHSIEKPEGRQKSSLKQACAVVSLAEKTGQNKHKSPWRAYNPEWLKSSSQTKCDVAAA